MQKRGRSCRRPRGSRSGVAGPADGSDLGDRDAVGFLLVEAAKALCLIESLHTEVDRQRALDDLRIGPLRLPAGRPSAVDEILVELDGLPARGHAPRVLWLIADVPRSHVLLWRASASHGSRGPGGSARAPLVKAAEAPRVGRLEICSTALKRDPSSDGRFIAREVDA